MRSRSLVSGTFALALALALALVGVAPLASASTWQIDTSHSSATFKVRHMMVSWVRGNIGGVEGTVDVNDQDFTKSKVQASLDAGTIDTDNAKRDDHLKGADFFNVAKNPKITFLSKSITGAPAGFKVLGALTLNGVTKDVELTSDGITAPVKGPQGDMRRGISATTKINRKDFNVTWNKSMDGGGVVVGDEIDVTLDLELKGDGKPSH